METGLVPVHLTVPFPGVNVPLFIQFPVIFSTPPADMFSEFPWLIVKLPVTVTFAPLMQEKSAPQMRGGLKVYPVIEGVITYVLDGMLTR